MNWLNEWWYKTCFHISWVTIKNVHFSTVTLKAKCFLFFIYLEKQPLSSGSSVLYSVFYKLVNCFSFSCNDRNWGGSSVLHLKSFFFFFFLVKLYILQMTGTGLICAWWSVSNETFQGVIWSIEITLCDLLHRHHKMKVCGQPERCCQGVAIILLNPWKVVHLTQWHWKEISSSHCNDFLWCLWVEREQL